VTSLFCGDVDVIALWHTYLDGHRWFISHFKLGRPIQADKLAATSGQIVHPP
jgi:hypothetical protein